MIKYFDKVIQINHIGTIIPQQHWTSNNSNNSNNNRTTVGIDTTTAAIAEYMDSDDIEKSLSDHKKLNSRTYLPLNPSLHVLSAARRYLKNEETGGR